MSPDGTADRPAPQNSAVRRLSRLIGEGGSVPISLFMAYANAHYYATRDPLGAQGDFTTAPEISQMFGELIGLWCADLWMRAGRPEPLGWVELGPGRGTLAADALRSMHRFGLEPDVHLVETSPVLRDLQAAAVPDATFHQDVSTLPDDRPLIIIANEFFDALPIRQLVMTQAGWRERVVTMETGRFVPAIGRVPMDAAVPADLRQQGRGSIIETSPAVSAISLDLAQLIASQGGALLVIDYGYGVAAPGDTLQAVSRHLHADAFDNVGEQDITAHVDFGMLAAIGRRAGVQVAGPVGQGEFLEKLGIVDRAAALIRARPDRADDISSQQVRLTALDEMGQLFKVLAMTAPAWPEPEGFAQ